MMDAASWELYEAIRDGCCRIAIVILMQTDDDGEFKTHSTSKDAFERVWFDPSMQSNRVIELPRLREEYLEQMLLHNAPDYYKSYKEEIKKMKPIEKDERDISEVEKA